MPKDFSDDPQVGFEFFTLIDYIEKIGNDMTIIVSRLKYGYKDIAAFLIKYSAFFMKASKNLMNLSNKLEINK